jgi:hypothetical protein
MTIHLTSLFIGLLAVATAGCNVSRAAPGQTTGSSASVLQAAPASAIAATVTKIVFVGKEHACDCTRKRVDEGWGALQRALGTPPRIPVERLQIDTDDSRVEPYRKQRPVMALPGIYFVDAKESVVELLQGEVTTEQVVQVIGGAAPAP